MWTIIFFGVISIVIVAAVLFFTLQHRSHQKKFQRTQESVRNPKEVEQDDGIVGKVRVVTKSYNSSLETDNTSTYSETKNTPRPSIIKYATPSNTDHSDETITNNVNVNDKKDDVTIEIDHDENSEDQSTQMTEDTDIEKSEATPQFISLYLMAEPDRPYTGYDLLQVLLSAGLQHGDHQIFHYVDNETTENLFSVASAVKPGTFDLDQMGGFSTLGLTMIMPFNKARDNNRTLHTMMNTLEQLFEELGGQMLNESRDPLTQEDFIRWQSQIKQFEQAHHTMETVIE